MSKGNKHNSRKSRNKPPGKWSQVAEQARKERHRKKRGSVKFKTPETYDTKAEALEAIP